MGAEYVGLAGGASYIAGEYDGSVAAAEGALGKPGEYYIDPCGGLYIDYGNASPVVVEWVSTAPVAVGHKSYAFGDYGHVSSLIGWVPTPCGPEMPHGSPSYVRTVELDYGLAAGTWAKNTTYGVGP